MLTALGVVPLLGGGASPGGGRTPEPRFLGSVTLDQPLFADGDYIPFAEGRAAEHFGQLVACGTEPALCSGPNGFEPVNPCVEPASPCWAYSFDVAEEADVLRVAMDRNTRDDCYWAELFAPGDYEDRSQRETTAGLLHCPEVFFALFLLGGSIHQSTIEVRLPDPEPGLWTLRLIPATIDEMNFRLRIALEELPAELPSDEGVPPNLVMFPPYEFGFVAPASPKAGGSPDDFNPPGTPLGSCTTDERDTAAEDGQALDRCLRFSFALENRGEGTFAIRMEGRPDPNVTQGPATQVVFAADGSVVREVAAGEWEFHQSHGHAHYVGDLDNPGFVAFELYRVLDPATRELEFVSESSKTGMATADQHVVEWGTLAQQPQNGWFGLCPIDRCIGLNAGWSDYYRWQRPGNFVPFSSDAPDGDYLVRAIADRDDFLLETRENDNAAYAWLRIAGDVVIVCERGTGLSPWDEPNHVHEPLHWVGRPGGTTLDEAADGCA